ncbi:hypothetical protein ETAA8_46550 [Anatilimnocola aggregata]|uniref:Uncharacterized protein n=1 Tax=Anatilimnocola aggregata TaxID=2528021 RepID=A0A517YH66_9BACT|nr:hypothetical protein [Anatilimnocola aggregata]QDU29541.1 hypothetical protein ETAA8_46550 [Anatilimnocola aggregata]
MNEVAACRSVLIEVLTILGKELDNLVIVGGWVPELVFPNKGHIGSLDVDLALDAAKLKPLIYESIRQRLIQSGYQQSSEMPNRFFRTLTGSNTQIKVDLITGEFPETAGVGSHLLIQELSVWKARGVDLAFAFQQSVQVEGILPDGGHNEVVAKLPTIAAYLCIKAITLSERKKEKDAYDICFCIDNYTGGYKALAEEFRGKLDHKLIQEGVAILRSKFARLDSIGPVWAAQVESTADSGAVFEAGQRRAFELVNALLREIDEIKK